MLSDRNIGGHSIVRAEWFSKDRGGLPKSHNGPVSPHLSVPLQRNEWVAHLAVGKQGTLRDSQGPLADPRVFSWVTVPLTPGNMLRFVYVCLPFSFRWADVRAVSSKERQHPSPFTSEWHIPEEETARGESGNQETLDLKGSVLSRDRWRQRDHQLCRAKDKRTRTHSRMVVFSRCWVVNESHLFTASTYR